MSAISVVICSRNRGSRLAVTLDRFRRLLGDPAWDLVVIDDGSTDDTPARLAGLAAAFGSRLTTGRSDRRGLGAARQAGWRAARGTLVLFTDDDCFPASDLLYQIRCCFEEAALDFLGGRLLPFTPDDGPVSLVQRIRRVDVAGPGFVPAGLIPGANLTVRRAALEAVGGFDPEFGAGTPFPAEDVELVARLAAAGLKGAFDPRPVVYHHHGRRSAADIGAVRRSYDVGRGAYYAKCLTNPALRAVYGRSWLRTILRGSLGRSVRELAGAIRYWLRVREAAPVRDPRVHRPEPLR